MTPEQFQRQQEILIEMRERLAIMRMAIENLTRSVDELSRIGRANNN